MFASVAQNDMDSMLAGNYNNPELTIIVEVM
jgi:hypothetical protein